MKNQRPAIAFVLMVLALAYAVGASHSEQNPRRSTKLYSARADTIENFDDGIVQLFSYPGEDFDTSAWALDTSNTYNNSPYSFKLWGNTWKIESIVPVTLDTNDVWQVASYIETLAEIQGSQWDQAL
ncbi:hypothetical protein IBX73_05915 [candidate division WOR-3 bacterium]|nr:hypothetical protein [candidate division WOR-3 bacterium]